MQKFWHILLYPASFALLLTASRAYGQSQVDSRAPDIYPTFYALANFGFTTTKSEMLASNDTGTALRYGIGGFASSARTLEFYLGFQTDSTAFALNDGAVTYGWQDTKIRYHLWYLYAGAVFSKLSLEIKEANVDIVSAQGAGFGATAGFLIPLGKGHAYYLDITQVAISDMKNELEATITVPSRIDIDTGARVSLIGKWLDLQFGYRMRTLTHALNSSSSSDAVTETYVGFSVSTTR